MRRLFEMFFNCYNGNNIAISSIVAGRKRIPHPETLLEILAFRPWSSYVQEMPEPGEFCASSQLQFKCSRLLHVFTGKYTVCAPKKQYETLNTILIYADTIVTLLIPYILLIIINVIIARRIATFYHTHRTSFSADFDVTDGRSCRVHGGSCNLGMKAQIKITKMLFLISAVFLLLNLPSYAMRLRVILMSFFNKDYEGTPQEFLLQQLFQFLYYINFTINFLLYSGCSDKFREAFR